MTNMTNVADQQKPEFQDVWTHLDSWKYQEISLVGGLTILNLDRELEINFRFCLAGYTAAKPQNCGSDIICCKRCFNLPNWLVGIAKCLEEILRLKESCIIPPLILDLYIALCFRF